MSEREPLVFVVSAPSGAGKSTVLSRLMAAIEGLRFSVSHTTRAPRGEERDGCEYHFVSRDAFLALRDAGALLEWAEVHGHLYGTSRAEVERARRDGCDLLLDIDVQGAAQVRERLPGATTVFVMPPSYEALERRLRGRAEDDEATIRRRLLAAGREVAQFEHYDYLIVNDDLERCLQELQGIVRAARCRVEVAASRARVIAKSFEKAKESQTA